jgi:hypothetical protein
VRVDALAPWGLMQSCRRVHGCTQQDMHTSTRLTYTAWSYKGPGQALEVAFISTALARQASLHYAWCT